MATCPDSRSGDHRFSSISTIDHPMIGVYSIFDPYLHQPLVSSFFWHMSIACHMAARQDGLSTIAFWLEHLAGWPLKPNESGSSKILGLCGENHGIPQNTPLKCRPVKRGEPPYWVVGHRSSRQYDQYVDATIKQNGWMKNIRTGKPPTRRGNGKLDTLVVHQTLQWKKNTYIFTYDFPT